MRRILFLIVVGAATLGCADDVDDRPATWSYIHAAIIRPNCANAGCHSALTHRAGIDFSDPVAGYANARGFLADVSILRGLVPAYPRMPPDQPLPEADIALIQAWIDAGSQDD